MPLPTYLMSNFPSVRPSLNLQFDSQPTPEDMTSHLASVGATFSRASIGTYTDANGIIQEATSGQARPNYSTEGVHEGLLIEESRTNLIEESEDFSDLHYRSFNNAVITNTKGIAPDGKATAVLIQGASDLNWASGGSQLDNVITVSASTDYTLSVYVKSAGATVAGVALRNQSSGIIAKTQNVDISDGEWKRIDVTSQSGNTSIACIFGGADGDFYIWGAQLEEGSFPTSYIPTIPTFTSRASDGTYFDSSGVLQTASTNEERIDHKYIDGQWVEAGLLLEGASTNLLVRSEDFGTTWNDSNNATVSTNTTTAPDGTTTADELEATATSSLSYIYQSVTYAVTDYTISVYAKESSSSVLWLYVRDASEQGTAYFDLSDQSTQAVAGSSTTPTNLTIEDVGNGWYRCSATFDNTTIASTGSGFGVCDAKGSASVTAGKSVYLWGAQLEADTQPTSYIKTTGSTATRSADVYTTATKERSADVCYIDGTAFSDFYNQEEGTMFVDFTNPEIAGTRFFSINDDTTSNRIELHRSGADETKGATSVVNSGNIETALTLASINDGENKLILSVNDGAEEVITSLNGEAVTTQTSKDIPTVLSRINIGTNVSGGSNINGSIAKLIYFPRQLSDNELIKLTQ